MAFRGLVLGVPKEEVVSAFALRGVAAQVQALSPLTSLAFGLSGKRAVESRELPERPLLLSTHVLLVLWAATALLFFLTVTSFLLDLLPGWRIPLLVATLAAGVFSLAWTRHVLVATRRRPLEDAFLFPWDALFVPETALVALALALSLLLAGFVLLVLWLPALLLVLNVLSLGELWRSYRTVLVRLEDPNMGRVSPAAAHLLRAGGMLSRAWDPLLDEPLSYLAWKLRTVHLRVHRALVTFGVLSLALASMAVASRWVPSDHWTTLLIATGAGAAGALLNLLHSLYRRRRFRREFRPLRVPER